MKPIMVEKLSTKTTLLPTLFKVETINKKTNKDLKSVVN